VPEVTPRKPPTDFARNDKARLEVALARNDDDVRKEQQLRYQVFVEQVGACLSDLPSRYRNHFLCA